jgi:hypothetical protein
MAASATLVLACPAATLGMPLLLRGTLLRAATADHSMSRAVCLANAYRAMRAVNEEDKDGKNIVTTAALLAATTTTTAISKAEKWRRHDEDTRFLCRLPQLLHAHVEALRERRSILLLQQPQPQQQSLDTSSLLFASLRVRGVTRLDVPPYNHAPRVGSLVVLGTGPMEITNSARNTPRTMMRHQNLVYVQSNAMVVVGVSPCRTRAAIVPCVWMEKLIPGTTTPSVGDLVLACIGGLESISICLRATATAAATTGAAFDIIDDEDDVDYQEWALCNTYATPLPYNALMWLNVDYDDA